MVDGLFFGGNIFPSIGGHSLIARIISGSQGGRTRLPTACVDPQEESVYNVDTFKGNFYGSCHP
jgi:hypothetical protein